MIECLTKGGNQLVETRLYEAWSPGGSIDFQEKKELFCFLSGYLQEESDSFVVHCFVMTCNKQFIRAPCGNERKQTAGHFAGASSAVILVSE